MQHSAAESRVMSQGNLYDESQARAWLSATPPAYCLVPVKQYRSTLGPQVGEERLSTGGWSSTAV